MSYTKGPWKVGGKFWSDNTYICTADGVFLLAEAAPKPNAEDNARLIAQAPALLEALKLFMSCLHDDNGISFPTKLMFKIARATIAKAEGEAHNS